MMTLIQFPWSPFCITIRRILERHKIPHRVQNVAASDRESIIRATNGRAYTVPCLIDGKTAVTDFTDFGQEVARYVDRKYKLGLFPRDAEGVQAILARYIENDLESIGFKVDDSYVIPTLPLVERVMLTRFKERKFGKGCVQQWRKDRAKLNRQFAELLVPIDNMLASSQFLVADRPLFVDYDLYGILGNYLYCGRTKLAPLEHLRRWHTTMSRR
jgi:glutathione S-transferase